MRETGVLAGPPPDPPALCLPEPPTGAGRGRQREVADYLYARTALWSAVPALAAALGVLNLAWLHPVSKDAGGPVLLCALSVLLWSVLCLVVGNAVACGDYARHLNGGNWEEGP